MLKTGRQVVEMYFQQLRPFGQLAFHRHCSSLTSQNGGLTIYRCWLFNRAKNDDHFGNLHHCEAQRGFMKTKPVTYFISFVLLLSLLTACGGGGGGGGGSEAEESRLFLATNPDDQYFGSYLSGSESLTLLGDSTGTDDTESVLVYLNDDDQITVTNLQDGSQTVVIGGYQFTLTPTSDGSTVEVTDPDGGIVSYEFDSDGNLITDEATDTEDVTDTTGIDSSCIAYTADVSFCMNLDSSVFPASYCTVDAINTTGGGNGAFTSVSYSDAALCAQRGYPYLQESTVVEGWSAWYQVDMNTYSAVSAGSLNVASAISIMATSSSDNPFDTSTCNDEMYSGDDQWESCTKQQLTAFKATSDVMFQPEIAFLIKKYYTTLKPAWDKAVKFVENFSLAQKVDETLATGEAFAANLVANALNFASDVAEGLDQLFEDKESGEYSDSYPGLDNLDDVINQVFEAADTTLAEAKAADEATEDEETTEEEGTTSKTLSIGGVSLPEAASISCEYSERSMYYHADGEFTSYLQCEGTDSNGGLVFSLTENINPNNNSNQATYALYLAVYNNGENGIFESYSYQESAPLDADAVESIYRSSALTSPGEITAFYIDSASYAVGYGYTSLVVELQDKDAVYCRDDMDNKGSWLIATNSNEEACPYEKSADETLMIHEIKREDMWLETGAYQQYL